MLGVEADGCYAVCHSQQLFRCRSYQCTLTVLDMCSKIFNLSSVQEVIPVFMPISFEATGSPPSINVGVDGWMLPFSGLRGTVETVIPPFCVRLPLRISHQFMNVYGRLLQFTIIYQFRKCYANHVASASP